MASKIAAIFCFVLVCPTLFIAVQSKETNQFKQMEVDRVSNVLSDKGYVAMALTIDLLFDSLYNIQFSKHNITQITLFCPRDQAFFSRNQFPQPPLSLLQYHVVPFKLDRQTLEESFSLGSKVETLTPNHSLIVTSLPGTGKPSLNLVKVRDWDLYNNGRITIHGVDDFFDPAFQTLVRPKEKNEINPWVIRAIESSIVLVFLAVVCLSVLYFVSNIYEQHEDIEYPLLK